MQIIFPVIQMLLIAAAFGLCGYLFLTVKQEIQASEKRRKSETSAAEQRIAALEADIQELRKELETMPSSAAIPVGSAGINLNKRTQALRMMKLGEGPEHIAATLSLPRKEVELLAKVQRMLLDASSPSIA